MHRFPSLNTSVVFRTPSWSRDNGSPKSASSPIIRWKPHNEVFRRFSDDATEDEGGADRMTFEKAEIAYRNAVNSLHSHLNKDEVATVLSKSTIGKQSDPKADLHRIAWDIQRTKEAKLGEGKTKKLIECLDHYQGVFDILSQAEFSGLPLIWGGLKFVLLVTKNNSNVLSKVIDVMIDIGRDLERIRGYIALYPTPRMLEFSSELYAAIVEFLEKVIRDAKNAEKNILKRAMTTFLQPFDARYGELVMKMKKTQLDIREDAELCFHIRHAMVNHAIDRYRTVLPLQRHTMHQAFKSVAENPTADLFKAIRKNLFKNFEVQAGFHQELQATYEVTTSKAWIEWFSMEQKYVPSGYSHETKVIQAECDAPDPQHALVWKKQQRKFASHVPSAYLIWTRGMTAQSAIASLVDQILVQKTEVMIDAGIDLEQFKEANNSVASLWKFFTYLTRVLGGCMVYITIGSVGEQEFAIVGKFVRMAKNWKGPPVNVTLIHPFNDNFARTDDVVNLDDKYDVHPRLTTTDAMHHVLLLEINPERKISDTIRSLLWETVWREVRYAVIVIALTQVIDKIHDAAKRAAQEAPSRNQSYFSDADIKRWVAVVGKWTAASWSMNSMREQIQRHIDIVDIHLPAERKKTLEGKLSLLVFEQDEELGSQLTFAQREAIWVDVQEAIKPGTAALFCGEIETLVAAMLEDYRNEGLNGEENLRNLSFPLVDTYFGKGGRWKDSFSENQELIADGMTDAIEIGFVGLIQALALQETE
ncbi:hypothetical protein HER10_EVM0001834 [Colletotrichum scovillei]|uniref:NACHT domain protein n=1 Tax=Colletotrichum scovillei TaxID=1209932 RepID=A0A9P7RH80_9PEZI|nr:uncharacterized protein HER10_EVM0001834 [Colletotrichum scovillei]KAF4779207.1 hypothetical protein HER10_EVM0001834 [Colletotrichum scovillei]KAG7058473.1 NACHT domain protein [Colletotrichum scovillei]KAG7077016.1 NACHT domain protein [Colletotrichum scovillei]KAG7084094.1 NACHT domain protein [Colletotrichum scovillei]